MTNFHHILVILIFSHMFNFFVFFHTSLVLLQPVLLLSPSSHGHLSLATLCPVHLRSSHYIISMALSHIFIFLLSSYIISASSVCPSLVSLVSYASFSCYIVSSSSLVFLLYNLQSALSYVHLSLVFLHTSLVLLQSVLLSSSSHVHLSLATLCPAITPLSRWSFFFFFFPFLH